ncbi:MAG: hypothetical protein RLZZ390_1175, partial [Bacteroidota bacterium]
VMNALLNFSKSPMNAAAEQAFFDRMNKSTEVEDRWMPDAFAVVLNANGGKLMKKHLADRIKNSSATKTAVAPMDHSMHQMGTAPKTQAAKVEGLDLVITDIKIDPSSPAVRERIAVTVEVKNQGSVDLKNEVFVPILIFVLRGKELRLISSVAISKRGSKLVKQFQLPKTSMVHG